MAQEKRNAAECPPGVSLTDWMKNGPTKKRKRSATQQQVYAAAIRELAKLLPTAVREARKGKPALLRLILRATK